MKDGFEGDVASVVVTWIVTVLWLKVVLFHSGSDAALFGCRHGLCLEEEVEKNIGRKEETLEQGLHNSVPCSVT